MWKITCIVAVLMLLVAFVYSNEIIENTESVGNEKILLSEIDKLEHSVNKQFMNKLLGNTGSRQRMGKRSDIDSRLMELQAKIDFLKAYQNMPAGHGRFDFDQIGKR